MLLRNYSITNKGTVYFFLFEIEFIYLLFETEINCMHKGTSLEVTWCVLCSVAVGILLFYICIILYLYGDLAIYAVAVPETLRDVTWYASLMCSVTDELMYKVIRKKVSP